jgi:hypothetical protein
MVAVLSSLKPLFGDCNGARCKKESTQTIWKGGVEACQVAVRHRGKSISSASAKIPERTSEFTQSCALEIVF